jgi:ribonuclease P protein component
MANFSFPKAERVCHKRDIERLFSREAEYEKGGLVAMRYLFRDKQDTEPATRVLIVVPKRKVKMAKDRNRLKRQLREVYRLNPALRDNVKIPANKTLLLAVIYAGGNEDTPYKGLEKSFIRALKSIAEKQDNKLNNN